MLKKKERWFLPSLVGFIQSKSSAPFLCSLSLFLSLSHSFSLLLSHLTIFAALFMLSLSFSPSPLLCVRVFIYFAFIFKYLSSVWVPRSLPSFPGKLFQENRSRCSIFFLLFFLLKFIVEKLYRILATQIAIETFSFWYCAFYFISIYFSMKEKKKKEIYIYIYIYCVSICILRYFFFLFFFFFTYTIYNAMTSFSFLWIFSLLFDINYLLCYTLFLFFFSLSLYFSLFLFLDLSSLREENPLFSLPFRSEDMGWKKKGRLKTDDEKRTREFLPMKKKEKKKERAVLSTRFARYIRW